MSRRTTLFVLLLAAIVVAAFSQSLAGEFVWDDRYLVLDDVRIQDRYRAAEIFTEPFAHTERAGRLLAYYRPAVTFSYFLNHRWSGLEPWSYHAVNIALHLLVCLLFWRLVRFVLRGQGLAIALTLLFALHPAHAASVAWIAGRVDLLAGVFLLSALLLYLQARVGGWHTTAKWMSLPVLFLALASKEIAFVYPGLVLLVDLHLADWRLRPALRALDWRYYLACVVVLGLFFALRAQVLDEHAGIPSALGAWQRAPEIASVLALYLRILFVPFGLQGYYFPSALAGVWPSTVAVAVLFAVGVGYAICKRRGPILLGAVWTLGLLLPVVDLLAFDGMCVYVAADHRSYLPSVGALLMVGGLCEPLVRRTATRPWLRRLVAVVAGVVVVAFAVETWRISARWQSDRILFARMADESRSEETLLLAGFSALDRGDLDAAERAFRDGLAIAPASWRHRFGLAEILIARDELPAAKRELLAATGSGAVFTDAFNHLGNLHLLDDEHGEAVDAYVRALELAPRNYDAMFNLGQAYRLSGDAERAAHWLERFVNEAPATYDVQRRQAVQQLRGGR